MLGFWQCLPLSQVGGDDKMVEVLDLEFSKDVGQSQRERMQSKA